MRLYPSGSSRFISFGFVKYSRKSWANTSSCKTSVVVSVSIPLRDGVVQKRIG